MGLSFYDLQAMTRNWTDRHAEQRAMDDLYAASESAARLTLTQAVFHYRAAQLAAEIEAALVGAAADLEARAKARDAAVAKVRGILADLEAAEVALEAVGRPGQVGDRERALSQERRTVTRLTKAHQEVGEELRRLKREHAAIERKVASMGRVITALRGVAKPNRAIVRALAEALNDASE